MSPSAPTLVPQAQEAAASIIGTRPIRHDGIEKVTGAARYGNDLRLPGTLAGKLLRSPYAHARILSVDTSRAVALPGVRAVVTAADFPEISARLSDQIEGGYHNPGFLARNCLARGKALYRGHAVAAVAADNAHIAEEALSLIDVQYEVLAPVLDGVEAMQPAAPILHENLHTIQGMGLRGGGLGDPGDADSPTNVASSFMLDLGDVATGFEAADFILERDYRTGAAHQGYIEPQSATAWWTGDGLLTVWCTTQGQFAIREFVAAILDLPVGSVKVIPSEIGGGFGAKTFATIEPVAAVLARRTGRPVKVTLSRTEVFECMGPTSATQVHLKMGFTNDGRITAADARLVYEAGAFPGSPVIPGASCMFAPYDIPNVRAEGFDVVVNKPKVAAYRAPGAPSAAFASESMIDEAAERLGMDPLELRLLNAAAEGTRRLGGVTMPSVGIVDAIEAARATEHYRSPLGGPNRGRGVAAGFWGNASGPAAAIANVLPDGRVSLVEGSPDIGGSRTVIAMQFAQTLGIPVTDVRPSVGDTDSIGFTSTTGGSSVAFKSGYAAHEAALDIRRQVVERAAKMLRVDPSTISFEAGVVTTTEKPGARLTFREVAEQSNSTGGPIVGRAAVSPRGAAPAYALHIVDVEVDPDTGKTQVLRYTTLQDAGIAIHPSYVEGQMQGGAAQGVGWALSEEYVYGEDGRMQNASLLDYRMPTSLDLPSIDAIIIEVPNKAHPYGVRGVGEVPIVPPLAAIANAVKGATGVRIPSVPLSPRVIMEALEARGR